jgi:hypothetical protein
MKSVKLIVVALLLAGPVFAQTPPQGDHKVKTYTKKDGTTVHEHYQTNPNHTQKDNYSSKGNVNPHTGATGTKTPKY